MSAPTSDYMSFDDIPQPGRKTAFVRVLSKTSGGVLGVIRWWGPWRQYVFEPGTATLFNRGCMREIIAYIDWLMAQRRKSR